MSYAGAAITNRRMGEASAPTWGTAIEVPLAMAYAESDTSEHRLAPPQALTMSVPATQFPRGGVSQALHRYVRHHRFFPQAKRAVVVCSKKEEEE